MAGCVTNVSSAPISILGWRVKTSKSLIHGGDLQSASEYYGIGVDQWVDLSTGINPESYPIDRLDTDAFRCLPYLKADFLQAAKAYYVNENLLTVSGSQAVIQLLPECLPELSILLPKLGYQEHRHQWLQSVSPINDYPATQNDQAINYINAALQKNKSQHLLVINPNNPSGLQFSPAQLQVWAQQLGKDAYLIIDEAFMDLQPKNSVLAQHFEENMIVLRSFGKFFGLAGLRLGFVFSNEEIRENLENRLGLWAINGPAQSLATLAFQDKAWQQQAQINISASAEISRALFAPLFDDLRSERYFQEIHQGLFSSYYLKKGKAEELSDFFAKQGVLLRHIPCNHELEVLRVGRVSPDNHAAIARIKLAVDECLKIKNRALNDNQGDFA